MKIRRLIEQTGGDLAQRAIARDRNAFGLEIGWDDVFSLRLALPGKRLAKRRHETVRRDALALRELVEQRVEARRTPEIVAQLESPALRQVQRIDQRVEQCDIAEAKTEVGQACAPHRLRGEEHVPPRRRRSLSEAPKHSMPAWRNSRGCMVLGPSG